ncbi:hypothetical protein BHE74_00024697 [Ensete ventricosum]|nr:hypothetical protein GW17_00008819 [Ensete ventricosum]RWW67821.1 hypothetical protein BHE74_00024697 [Ensete ventricosum]RZR81337.1 hypothetical protein BHM03_00007533 [Ensete ventricosum]
MSLNGDACLLQSNQEVPESQRADAANSLVYEANIRLRDPVYGSLGVISTLQQQVQALEAELAAVKAQILKCKYRQTAAAAILPTPHAAAFLISNGVISGAAPRAPASSSSSMFAAAASSSTDYSSITNDNVSLFG